MTDPKQIPASKQSLPERLRALASNDASSCFMCIKRTGAILSIADEIERQQAELEQSKFLLKEQYESDANYEFLIRQNVKLEAELEHLRGERGQDTARLDFLQSGGRIFNMSFDTPDLRSVIDAARDAARDQGGGENG